MGLDVSHDAWHGAYSAFHRWRTKLASVAGVPLVLMEGFYGGADNGPKLALEEHKREYETWARPGGGPTPKAPVALWNFLRDVCDALPVRWDALKPDVIHVLLNHSDCDGEIAHDKLAPLAMRLRELAELMPDEDGGGHVRNWRETTLRFADGCMRAHEAGEPLDFH